MTFSVGQKVKFSRLPFPIKKDESISNYTLKVENIPINLIKHGTSILKAEFYNQNHAKIVYIGNNDYYVVRFMDTYGKFVQLGYHERDLEGVYISNWRQELE